MDHARKLTAIIEREHDGYVALCPEVDAASQGVSIEEARTNLIGALTLFFEVASTGEIGRRMHSGRLTWRAHSCVPCRDFLDTSSRG